MDPAITRIASQPTSWKSGRVDVRQCTKNPTLPLKATPLEWNSKLETSTSQNRMIADVPLPRLDDQNTRLQKWLKSVGSPRACRALKELGPPAELGSSNHWFSGVNSLLVSGRRYYMLKCKHNLHYRFTKKEKLHVLFEKKNSASLSSPRLCSSNVRWKTKQKTKKHLQERDRCS